MGDHKATTTHNIVDGVDRGGSGDGEWEEGGGAEREGVRAWRSGGVVAGRRWGGRGGAGGREGMDARLFPPTALI